MSQLFAKKSLKVLLEEMAGEHRLRRVLGPVGLSALGVGAIIGTGIFVMVGKVAHDKTGPSLMVSFVVAGLACAFAALCYAEFASMAPVAGSAYTYAYTTLGELLAWIIGWDLVLEYAVGAATVAHGWSGYMQDFLKICFKYELPERFRQAPINLHFESTNAICDLLAIVIAAIMTVILVIGIRESAGFNAAMVILKLAIVLMVIVVGAFYINPENWTNDFAPHGWLGINLFGYHIGQTDSDNQGIGMLAGASMIFFAYIGFDSVSTHAEEAKNPSRDVPIGIIASLVICTILYIAVAAVITGIIPYSQLTNDAPVSNAFGQLGIDWARIAISIGAVAGMTSVLLVMMLSQPRVLLAMARDGLLPSGFFGDIHPVFRTPWKSTILTGLFVGALGGLLPLDILAEMVNIGTLLAFVIVCAAVLIMRQTNPQATRPFKAPFYPVTPILGILLCLLLMLSLPWENWVRLAVWLAIGMVIYFGYGMRHSILGKELRGEIASHGISPAGMTSDSIKEIKYPSKD